MKKRVLISVSVILLTLAAGVYLVNRKGAFSSRNTSFAAPDGARITRIELKKEGEVISLLKSDEGWRVNGNSEARSSAVAFLVQTLTEVSVKSPVSDELFMEAVTSPGVKPIRVKAWAGGRLVCSFMLYRTDANKYGNISVKRAGSKPFIISVPGYEGDIGVSFTMREEFWKPFTVFNEVPSAILSASVDYPARPADSFTAANPMYVDQSIPAADTLKFNPEAVRRFLSYFTRVPFESWEVSLNEAIADSIITSVPLAVIKVTLKGGSTKTLRIWEKFTITGGTRIEDTDRAWGALDGGSKLFILRYFDIDPILRRRGNFFQDE